MAGYRSILVPPNPAASRRRALIALALWGDPVVDLFVRYCLPSLLSPGNLPALSRMREVHVVAYTAAAHAEALRQAAPFQRLADLVHAQISRFPQEILAPPGSADLRSWISGGLHHVAIEQARGLDADLMILAPDCVYSDGSLANCARFIDEGYRAVVAPAVRAQAEGVCPLYDGWRDEAAHTLTVSARRLAEVATQNLHLGYARNLAVRDNQSMPFGPSFLVFPHARGVYIRSLRLYPHMIAADVLKTPIVFDYAAIDGHAMAGFFPNPEDWARVKVLENSDDGLWLEMGYAGAPDVSPGSTFRLDLLTADGYLPHQIRAFQHRLDVHGDSTMDAVGAFERLPTGAVERRAVPVASRIELDDQAVAAWFAANLPKPPRPALRASTSSCPCGASGMSRAGCGTACRACFRPAICRHSPGSLRSS